MDEKTAPSHLDDESSPAGPDDETVPAFALSRAEPVRPVDADARSRLASQDGHPKLEPGTDEASAMEGNRAVLEDLAKTFRRVEANEDFSDEGTRTVRHRGRMQTELLSWENRAGLIVKQELSFLGVMVEYRQGKPIRTGTVPHDDSQTEGDGRQTGSQVTMDAAPTHRTLDHAAHLLRHVPGRDYYAQHLLKHVSDEITDLGLDEGRTVVSSLEQYSKKAGVQTELTPKVEERSAADETSTRVIVIALLGTAAVLVGLGVGLLLW